MHALRSALPLCLATALALTACCAPPPPAPILMTKPVTVRIGTWNLEHFGQRDKFQNRPDAPHNRTPEQIRGIAAFIKEMEVDVLALQEIGGPEPMRRLLAHLPGYAFALGTTGVYDDTRISPGFLWNTKTVRLLQCEEMKGFPREVDGVAVFHRLPVNAVFRVIDGDEVGFDFRAITVHLKASRGAKNEKKRMAEVGVLRRYIEELRRRPGEDQDIVVLGDFNHTYGAPAAKVFCEGDFVRYAASAEPRPTIVWFDDPIDQCALTEGIRTEVIPGSYRVHNQRVDFTLQDEALVASKAAWRVPFSDHFPVTLDFNGGIDRDPIATFAPAAHPLEVER